jgi:mono/diheme cytochrome c family protein
MQQRMGSLRFPVFLGLGIAAALSGAGFAAAQDKPNEFDGEKLFATTCGWCHANNGHTAGKGPKLAGITKSDDFILNRIRMGKPGAMPAFGTNFSDDEIHAILAYIRSLKDEPGQGSSE